MTPKTTSIAHSHTVGGQKEHHYKTFHLATNFHKATVIPNKTEYLLPPEAGVDMGINKNILAMDSWTNAISVDDKTRPQLLALYKQTYWQGREWWDGRKGGKTKLRGTHPGQ